MINPDQSQDAAMTWFLGNMFMDRYFIVNNYDRAIKRANIMPTIGIYDKWHPSNGNWRPEQIDPLPVTPPSDNSGGASNIPENKDKDIDEPHDGSGTFWAIFLVLLFFGLIFVVIKFCGTSCWEKIDSVRNGGGATFDTSGEVYNYNNGPVYASGAATTGESILPKEDPHNKLISGMGDYHANK